MLAEEAERSGRGRQAFWQRKPNVLVVEDDRVGGGKANALAVWGQALWQRKTSALAEEDTRACCGKRVRLLWKTSALAVEDEWAGCGRSRGFRRT